MNKYKIEDLNNNFICCTNLENHLKCIFKRNLLKHTKVFYVPEKLFKDNDLFIHKKQMCDFLMKLKISNYFIS